jgi:hypothetical protein
MVMADITFAGTPMTFQPVLDGERIHHGGEHAHVVGGTAVHAAGRPGDAAEDVARADHQANSMPRSWNPGSPGDKTGSSSVLMP